MIMETNGKPVETGIVRNEHGQFVKGVSGNPKGPGMGYKKKLNAIIEAVADTFEGLGGQAGFQGWAANHKEAFYKMVMQLLPKELKVEQEGGDTHIHISPEKVLIFKDMANVKDDGRADNIHAEKGPGSNRV